MSQIRNKKERTKWLVSEFAEGGGGDNKQFFSTLRKAKVFAATTKYGYTISKCRIDTWDELRPIDDEGRTRYEWQEQWDYEILKQVAGYQPQESD